MNRSFIEVVLLYEQKEKLTMKLGNTNHFLIFFRLDSLEFLLIFLISHQLLT